MNHDRIEIKDLLVRGIVGVNESERRKRQDILVNVTMLADTRRAAETDNLDVFIFLQSRLDGIKNTIHCFLSFFFGADHFGHFVD